MVRTYGLTHLDLTVWDLNRALRFYQQVFGATVLCRTQEMLQVQTPGTMDVIAFQRGTRRGQTGDIAHFGFRLQDAGDVDQAVADVERAGGTLLSRAEDAPGVPFAYVRDPDGYEIEIWYE